MGSLRSEAVGFGQEEFAKGLDADAAGVDAADDSVDGYAIVANSRSITFMTTD